MHPFEKLNNNDNSNNNNNIINRNNNSNNDDDINIPQNTSKRPPNIYYNNHSNNILNGIDNDFSLSFTWFLFVIKRIYNFSSTLTVILSVVGHITRDACISFHQFKSSGFFHSLLRMQNM